MKNKQYIVVLGGGESGVGAAILAKKQGFDVLVSDLGSIKAAHKKVLQEYQIDFEEGGHSKALILEKANLVIKSPGIPNKVAMIQALLEKGVEVIDELEFAARYTKGKIIAITGSNGKTTTTRLVHHILETASLDVGLAGNIGFSWAKQVAENDRAYYALEVSSFQLDNMYQFNPAIAILVNITPDHLDRYDYKLSNYIASKFRIIQNKTTADTFIYSKEDENIAYGFEHYFKADKAGLLPVSMKDLEGLLETFRVPYTDFEMPVSELTLKGRHNYFNMQCAVLAAKQLGVENEVIRTALQSFVNDPHRLESVISLNGVEYINDSKATNVDATYFALEAMDKTTVWIVGGVDKGNDYTPLIPFIKDKVRAIVCLGKDNSKIKAALEEVHEIIVETLSVEEAIKVASLYAEEGDAVLLSPACASFDLFSNYIDRGNQFKEILLHQHKIMTEGVQVSLDITINVNPSNNQTDTNKR